MGFLGSLDWPNYFNKKRCKTMFFRFRAKLKKALKDNGASSHKKKQLRFQYDPSSYALNFDDGGCCFSNNFEDGTKKKKKMTLIREDEPSVLGFYTDVHNTTWVYVVWGPILGHQKL